MKAITIAALALGIWVVPFPQDPGQPKERIVQRESAPSTQKAANSEAKQRAAESEAIQRLISQELEIQRQNAQILQAAQTKSNEEIAIEGKIVEYTRALVWVGAIQAIVFFFTLLAIKRQANIMKSQFALTLPRLHVDRVRAAWFEVGQRPVFFVKVINSGIVAAENVSISIKAEFAGSTVQYKSDQVIVIPADSWRESFIVSPIPLDGVVLAGCNSGSIPLRVSGHIAWGNQKPTEYCYKYYPWPFDQPRPEGLRHFVPCDFDTAITVDVEVKATMNQMTASLGTVLIKTESGTKEPPNKTPKKPNEPN